MKVTQLTVFLENRSGRLAEVADLLGAAPEGEGPLVDVQDPARHGGGQAAPPRRGGAPRRPRHVDRPHGAMGAGFVAREEERAFHGVAIIADAAGRASEPPTQTLDLTLKDSPR